MALAAGLTLYFFHGCSPAPQPDPISYARDVQPILASKCYACHGPDGSDREASGSTFATPSL